MIQSESERRTNKAPHSGNPVSSIQEEQERSQTDSDLRLGFGAVNSRGLFPGSYFLNNDLTMASSCKWTTFMSLNDQHLPSENEHEQLDSSCR